MQQTPRSPRLDPMIPDDEAVSVAFRLDRDLVEAMKEAATARGMSVEAWLRDVVGNAVQQRRRAPRNVRMSRRVTTSF